MSKRPVIDVLAARNVELQEQLEQMTKNRAKALKENERKRSIIQELRVRLAGVRETNRIQEMRIGELVQENDVS